MLVEREGLRRALGATDVEVEPLSLRAGAPERVSAALPGGARTFLVRRAADPEAATNHIAIMEALARVGFRHVPTLVRIVDGASIETFIDGLTAMNVEPDRGTLEATMDLLAELHELPLREGLRWGDSPLQLLPPEELPLFRLGFTSDERAAAAPWLAAAVDALAKSPFGFSHGAATADHVIFGQGAPTLINFEAAGFGPQLMDVAAFLATSGVNPDARRALADRYGAARGLLRVETADLADLATLVWSLDWLLALPRRLIVNLGDDVASARLRLAASRVENAARTAAGAHPASVGVRQALRYI